MNMFPAVRANLAERFIFNFRMPPEAMAKYLPVSWLIPQDVNGYAVASFCLLDLRNITVAPLPTVCGLSSVSCAPRYAVVDESQSKKKPSVFVTKRFTNSAFGAWFTGLGCSAPHPYAHAEIKHHDEATAISVDDKDGSASFAAVVQESRDSNSEVFASTESFAGFIAEGVSSYGLSIRGDRLTKIDLRKKDNCYEPLKVFRIESLLIDRWTSDGAVFDSAFRTAGGRYEWTYTGLTK